MIGVGTILGAASVLGGLASQWRNNTRQSNAFDEQQAFSRYQFEDLKRYNSIPEQVRQMRAAGINPSIAFGKGSQQMSAVSQPAAPNLQPLNMQGLNGLINTAVQSDSERDKKNSETRVNHLLAIGQEIKNALDQKFGSQERQGQLNEQGMRIYQLYNDALLKAAQGDYTAALQKVAYSQEFLNYALGGKADQEMKNLVEDLKWIGVKAKAAIEEMRAGAANQRAQAANTGLDTSIKTEARESIVQTYADVMNKIQNESQLTKAQINYANQLAEKATKENSVFYWTLLADYLVKIGGEAADIFMFKKKIQALSGVTTYDDSEVSNTYDSKGNVTKTTEKTRRRTGRKR